MGWNYLSIPKLQQAVYEWISNFIPLYWACNYLSTLGLKLNHISKRGSRSPPLSIALLDFTNTSLCDAQNSRHLKLRIAHWWKQDNLLQNTPRQIWRHNASKHKWKQNEDRVQHASCNRPVSQIRAPPGGLSRTSGKLWQDYSNWYMFWT